MKKLLIVFIFSLFLLSACGKTPPNLEDRIPSPPVNQDENKNETYTGTVESIELDIYQQGTHQLKTEDGESIIIQSQTIDLNRYLGKKVIAEGKIVKGIGNTKPVLDVLDVKLGEGMMTDETENYENILFGLSFDYPGVWELVSGRGDITLKEGENELVTVEIFNDKTDPDAFAASREEGEGTPVTIGAQRSLRFTDDSVRVYIPNPPKKKIYLVTFKGTEEDEAAKEYFFRILESIKLIYRSVRTGDKCGGKENIACAEDYICELKSGEEDAEGICIPVGGDDNQQDCPYIAPPAGCNDYRISAYSKTGCPSRYECTEESVDLRGADEAVSDDFDVNSVMSVFDKYKNKILKTDTAEITEYGINEGEAVLMVIYSDEEEEYKVLYLFSPSADEFNFIEKSRYSKNEEGDWELASGTEMDIKITPVTPSSDRQAEVPELADGMAMYTNPHKNYSIEYPKNWYYNSFGAISGTRWLTGFSDTEMDSVGDAVITVSIVDEKPSDSEKGIYMVTSQRDDETYFVVAGPEEMKDMVDAMAGSIQ